MKKSLPLLAILFVFNLLKAQPNISLQQFGPTFSDPIGIKNAGDSRLFIVEKPGRIKILNADGSVNASPFLDITSLVIDTGSERGLLGLAFHPNYSSNGYFYVNYINNSGNTVISRFTRSMSDPNLADSNSESILLNVSQPYSNHNGGDLAFGPDGYLYIALGDGGNGGDPGNRAQSLNTLLGKMLRIDVNSGSPYAIPSDNPFLNDGDPNTLPEIWAYGLRNPWRFSIDTTNQDIWIADVGQNEYEEINKIPVSVGGINYGWKCYEGDHEYNTTGCPPANLMIFPVAEYSHSSSGLFKCSITGGYYYSGSMYPNFNGLYFFADYCSDEIGYLELNNGNWEMTLNGPYTLNNWSTFGEDFNGELYIAGVGSDRVYKIIDTNLSANDFSSTNFKIYPNPATNYIIIETSNFTDGTFEIFDFSGKLIKTFKNSNTSFELSTQELSKGIYFVKANFEKGTITKKLVIN